MRGCSKVEPQDTHLPFDRCFTWWWTLSRNWVLNKWFCRWVLWVKSNTHFARCGSYRIGEVPLGSRHKGERLTAPARLLWLSIRIAMMVLDADLHFALDRRSASSIQPQMFGFILFLIGLNQMKNVHAVNSERSDDRLGAIQWRWNQSTLNGVIFLHRSNSLFQHLFLPEQMLICWIFPAISCHSDPNQYHPAPH